MDDYDNFDDDLMADLAMRDDQPLRRGARARELAIRGGGGWSRRCCGWVLCVWHARARASGVSACYDTSRFQRRRASVSPPSRPRQLGREEDRVI